MGQRGQRKSRRRCRFVDLRTGNRCPKQVKKAGSKFCCKSHAARSRSKPSVTAPGAKAVYHLARQHDLDRLTEALRQVVDENGKVPLLTALPIIANTLDIRYQRGYATGRSKLRFEVRRLRLTMSKTALDEFLGGRFGKGFITGNLRADDLAKFKFGGGTNGRSS